jgi:hypothetical protein
MRNLSHTSRSLSRDLNPGPPEYEAMFRDDSNQNPKT